MVEDVVPHLHGLVDVELHAGPVRYRSWPVRVFPNSWTTSPRHPYRGELWHDRNHAEAHAPRDVARRQPAGGCGGSQKDVEVKGKETETAKLAGDWEGTYEGKESGRSGTVKFSLQLGMHTAEGEVFMGGDTPLKIQFIEVEGGQIQGTIAPYTDPNCSCQVETSLPASRDNSE